MKPQIASSHKLALWAVPATCCIAFFLGLFIFTTQKSQNPDPLLIAITLAAGSCLVWWGGGLVYVLLAKTLLQHNHSVPFWLPWCMKPLLTGSFILGAISSPAAGMFTSQLQPNTAITQVEESPALAQPSSLFPSPEQADSGQQILHQRHVETEKTVVPALSIQPAQSTVHSMSPFFTGSNHQEPQPSNSQSAKNNQHLVIAGDSLWSIAQQQLGAQASPAELMRYVHEIYQSNQDQLASLDSFIYAGQTLNLPTTSLTQ